MSWGSSWFGFDLNSTPRCYNGEFWNNSHNLLIPSSKRYTITAVAFFPLSVPVAKSPVGDQEERAGVLPAPCSLRTAPTSASKCPKATEHSKDSTAKSSSIPLPAKPFPTRWIIWSVQLSAPEVVCNH